MVRHCVWLIVCPIRTANHAKYANGNQDHPIPPSSLSRVSRISRWVLVSLPPHAHGGLLQEPVIVRARAVVFVIHAEPQIRQTVSDHLPEFNRRRSIHQTAAGDSDVTGAATAPESAGASAVPPLSHGSLRCLSRSLGIAQALRGRDAARLQPTGAYAANILGLSAQVPARTVFLTNGRSRCVGIGKQEIVLRHTTLRNMAAAGTTSGLVIQALRWLGRDHVDDQACALPAKRLTDDDKRNLMADARYARAWVSEVMRRARTSLIASSTARSSSAVGFGWDRLRSRRAAHFSGVSGWRVRRTIVPL